MLSQGKGGKNQQTDRLMEKQKSQRGNHIQYPPQALFLKKIKKGNTNPIKVGNIFFDEQDWAHVGTKGQCQERMDSSDQTLLLNRRTHTVLGELPELFQAQGSRAATSSMNTPA